MSATPTGGTRFPTPMEGSDLRLSWRTQRCNEMNFCHIEYLRHFASFSSVENSHGRLCLSNFFLHTNQQRTRRTVGAAVVFKPNEKTRFLLPCFDESMSCIGHCNVNLQLFELFAGMSLFSSFFVLLLILVQSSPPSSVSISLLGASGHPTPSNPGSQQETRPNPEVPPRGSWSRTRVPTTIYTCVARQVTCLCSFPF